MIILDPFRIVYAVLYLGGLWLVLSFFVSALQTRIPAVQRARNYALVIFAVLLIAYDNWVYGGLLDAIFGALTIALALIAALHVYQRITGQRVFGNIVDSVRRRIGR